MQAIDLSDEIDISNSPGQEIAGHPTLVSRQLPLTDAALKHLTCRTGRRPGQHVRVAKSIPLAAGLGGGSSDAATALLAVDRENGSHLGQSELTAICRLTRFRCDIFSDRRLRLSKWPR